MAMVLADDGSFYLAKSGQQLTYQGVDNGKILRVSSDGAQVETIATGLRQPYVGYIPQWDLLMASDQQGHWVPSTPCTGFVMDIITGFDRVPKSSLPVRQSPSPFAGFRIEWFRVAPIPSGWALKEWVI